MITLAGTFRCVGPLLESVTVSGCDRSPLRVTVADNAGLAVFSATCVTGRDSVSTAATCVALEASAVLLVVVASTTT